MPIKLKGNCSGKGNRVFARCVVLFSLGYLVMIALSLASTVLANMQADESDAKIITIVVTLFFFSGVIISCVWLWFPE